MSDAGQPVPSGLSAIAEFCGKKDCPFGAAPCEHKHALERYQLVQKASEMSMQLMRFALTHREEKVARLILGLSLGRGSRTVCIPDQAFFSNTMGATSGNVSEALKNLKSMRIIKHHIKNGSEHYEFNADPEEWRCRSLASSEDAGKGVRMVAAYNDHLRGAGQVFSNFCSSSDTSLFDSSPDAGERSSGDMGVFPS